MMMMMLMMMKLMMLEMMRIDDDADDDVDDDADVDDDDVNDDADDNDDVDDDIDVVVDDDIVKKPNDRNVTIQNAMLRKPEYINGPERSDLMANRNDQGVHGRGTHVRPACYLDMVL